MLYMLKKLVRKNLNNENFHIPRFNEKENKNRQKKNL